MSKPQVHWTEIPCELCKKNTLSINLDKVILMIKVWGDKYSHSEHWACDDCRKEIKEQENQVQLDRELENE